MKSVAPRENVSTSICEVCCADVDEVSAMVLNTLHRCTDCLSYLSVYVSKIKFYLI